MAMQRVRCGKPRARNTVQRLPHPCNRANQTQAQSEPADRSRCIAEDRLSLTRLSPRRSLGVLLCKHMKQISYGKQRETKHSTREIQVMTNAMLKPPLHPREQVECFGDMSKNDHHQTS